MAEDNQLVAFDQKYADLRALLFSPSMQEQLALALPRHFRPDRFCRLVMTETRRNQALLDCTRESLLGGVMEAAQMGLDVGTRGLAWLIPYKVKGTRVATLVVGYRGMLELAWRSEQIKSVYAHEVCEGDHFEFQFGDSPHIRHIPVAKCDRGEITHAYAGCETIYGGKLMDVMAIEDIELIKERSRAADRGPWVTDFPEMCKKTVLRRMLKLAPCSTELARALTLDEQADLGIDQHLEDQAVVIKAEEADAKPLSCEACGKPIDTTSGEISWWTYEDGKHRCGDCGPRE